MNRIAKLLTGVFLALAIVLCLSPSTANAIPPEHYFPGDEAHLFGHTFSENYWTNDSIMLQNENGSVQFIMSYVNYTGVGSFQAALLALGMIHNNVTGDSATLPYQLFALHFTTPSVGGLTMLGGKDIFVGAVFAFLYAYNDSNLNNLPDPTENRVFIIPYGFDNAKSNTTVTPEVTATPVTNPEPGHYQFGVNYTHLYARVVAGGPDLGAFFYTLLNPLMEIEISELDFTYDIEVNPTTGVITAETFYTIGQLQAIKVLGLNVPNPHQYLQNWAIGAAHFIVAFGSNYLVEPGSTIPGPAATWHARNLTVDGRRAFAVGVRGTYDLINETSGIPVALDQPAYCWIATPLLSDLLLVLWQAPLSADLLSVFAYAMSPTLQTLYDGPRDVYLHASNAFNKQAFWYAVAFPHWGGYRVVHDPVYTAYSNIGQVITLPPIPGFPLEAIGIGVAVALVAVFLVRRRKH